MATEQIIFILDIYIKNIYMQMSQYYFAQLVDDDKFTSLINWFNLWKNKIWLNTLNLLIIYWFLSLWHFNLFYFIIINIKLFLSFFSKIFQLKLFYLVIHLNFSYTHSLPQNKTKKRKNFTFCGLSHIERTFSCTHP